MREILFRGAQKVDCAKSLVWYEGSLIIETDGYTGEKEYYIQNENGSYLVIPETVGQYTGLTDKNSNKIFEGDIVKVCRGKDIEKGIVYYDERIGTYAVLYNDENINLFFDIFTSKDPNVYIEIIGNIHDNSELLKETDNE